MLKITEMKKLGKERLKKGIYLKSKEANKRDFLNKKDRGFANINIILGVLFLLICIVCKPLVNISPIMAGIVTGLTIAYLMSSAILLIWIKDHFYKYEFSKWKMYQKALFWVWILFLMTYSVYLFINKY